ncbi:uncharacterized protein B0H64DRAFT_400473 [Chaetomium fimeti]|uniref:Uncharacterized protein n=1 Tax=Chaetomium fimeti TaxID=1854472 RepID=A0AAE0HD69_9PEZI|nr:hypothetical protein B0H64DRAFT_400473 [Chaetomium fimeti]
MNTFQPQCTLPLEGPVFIQQPNVRSTLDIIWSSLAIILLCTWSILHLNVPPQVRPLPPPETFWQSCKRVFFEAWYPFCRKLKWLILTIFVPENIFGVALSEFWSACRCTRQIQEFQRGEKLEDEVEWTLTHSFYANMGGFVIKFAPEPAHPSDRMGGQGADTEHFLWAFIQRGLAGYKHLGAFDWNSHKTHYHLARRWIDEHQVQGHRRHPARALIGDTWTLSASQLLTARQTGIIKNFPAITMAAIDDKNKGDLVVKLLALGQVIWLIIQMCVRAHRQQPVSPVEVTALAYAGCSLFTYLLLLKKPQDVRTPTVVVAERSPTYDEFEQIMETAPKLHPFMNEEHQFTSYALPTSSVSAYRGYRDLMTAGLFGGLTVFGSLHLIAWNAHFPTENEQLLWRIFSLLVATLPILILASHALFGCLSARFPGLVVADGTGYFFVGVTGILLWLVMGISMVFFPLLRLGLLIEAFRSTYYLPPSAYLSTWASEIPHVG